MDIRYLITLRGDADRQAVAQTGVAVLAEYPSALLVRADAAQAEALAAAGLEMAEMPAPPAAAVSPAGPAAAPLPADPNRSRRYLLALAGPAMPEWLAEIAALGGEVEGNAGPFTLIVRLLPAAAQELAGRPWVEASAPYSAELKVAPALAEAQPDRRGGRVTPLQPEQPAPATAALPAEALTRRQVEIVLFPGEGAAEVAAQVRAGGGAVLSEEEERVVAVVDQEQIAALAALPQVQAITPFSVPVLHNDAARLVMGVPVSQVFADLTLTGANQIVAIGDTGLDTGNAAAIHADFAGRIAGITSMPVNSIWNPYITNPPGSDDGAADIDSGHGTHVAGSVLGNGASAIALGDPTTPRGVAPEARVFTQAIEQQVTWKTVAQLAADGLAAPFAPWPPAPIGLYGIPTNLNDLFTPAYAAGARIHTNSWGSSALSQLGLYNSNARAVDQFMWNNRDMLILFSAGNEGEGGTNEGTVGPPGTAKNCLTVGASENNRPAGSVPATAVPSSFSDNVEGMASFSGRGPTDEGRRKPDVVAPGTNVLSTRSSMAADTLGWGQLPAAHPLRPLYIWSGGTSMATPLVAGAAALVRQHLVEQRGHEQPGAKPSGALIKAFLVNGAVAMAGQVAGEIPAGPNNVNGLGRINLAEALTPGALARTLFADEPDYAVASGEMRTFQVQANDTAAPLKVTLVWTDAPALVNVGGLVNTLYLQVVPPGGAAAIDGDSTAFPVATNNVQQVVIPAPMAGLYEIRVRGVNVTQHAPGVPAGPAPRQDFALAVSNAMGMSLQPISIGMAIDTTGSMDFYGYIAPARERARQLADFMRANDRLSVTEFSTRPALPNARTPYALRLLGGFTPDWSDAHNAVDALVAEGMTPIGAGLQEAWAQLGGAPAAAPRAIVLLSDGFNNQPPDPAAVLPGIPADVPIFAVALGPASNTPALQTIAMSRPNGGYFAVESDEDIYRLQEIYAQVQALAGGGALIGLSSAEAGPEEAAAAEFPVEEGLHEATFSLAWDGDAGKEMEFTVFDPGGAPVQENTHAAIIRRGPGHIHVRVGLPKAGVWRAEARARANSPVRVTLSAAAPLAYDTRFTLLPLRLDGERLLITAALGPHPEPWRRVALPQDSAPLKLGRVTARVTMPALSLDKVLDKHGNQIKGIELPKELDEEKLTDEQRLLVQLSVFAREFRGREGGLFERTTTEVEMEQVDDLTWRAALLLAAAGVVRVEAVAEGEVNGAPIRRTAALAEQVAAAEPVAEDGLRIVRTIVRRSKRWRQITLGVRVERADGTPVTDADLITVNSHLMQGPVEAEATDLPYYRAGRYFIWRLADTRFASGAAMVTFDVAPSGGARIRSSGPVKL